MTTTAPGGIATAPQIATAPEAFYAALEAARPAEASRNGKKTGGAKKGRKKAPTRGYAPGPPEGGVGRPKAHARAALIDECRAVAETTPGDRNNRLNIAACKLGKYVAVLGRRAVVDALAGAARRCGLTAEEARATIDSGLGAGTARPGATPTDPGTPGQPGGGGGGPPGVGAPAAGLGPAGRDGDPETEPGLGPAGQTEGGAGAQPLQEEAPQFTNFDWEEAEDEEREGEGAEDPGGDEKKRKRRRVASRTADIQDALRVITYTALGEEWPRRVGPLLFVEGKDSRPRFLEKPAQLFAWIDYVAQVVWAGGPEYVSQERFYEHLRNSVPDYQAIRTAPHYPPMPVVYYMLSPEFDLGDPDPETAPPGRSLLDGLLDFFRPATPVDRELILAFLLTLFWGGPSGARPMFLITGPEEPGERGLGVGKSTLPPLLATAFGLGGCIDISPDEKLDEIKTRLLSPEALDLRVCLIDNLKTLKWSWAGYESLLTIDSINGKKMYHGDARRLNDLTYVVTLNGASLSEDLAQRSVPVRLARPDYNADWEDSVRNYVRDNLTGLLREIRHALTHPNPDFKPAGRWARWERAVLGAVDDPARCQRVLAERRAAVNADQDDMARFRDHLADRLTDLGYDPSCDYIIIPSATMRDWYNESEGEKHSSKKVTPAVRNLGIPELKYDKDLRPRGWTWRGTADKGNGPPKPLSGLPARDEYG
jgi:hypothetical protein